MVPRDTPSHENHPGAIGKGTISRDNHFLRFRSPSLSQIPRRVHPDGKIAHPAFLDHPVQSAALNRVSVRLGTATPVVSDCRVCFALGSRWTGCRSPAPRGCRLQVGRFNGLLLAIVETNVSGHAGRCTAVLPSASAVRPPLQSVQ